MNDEIKPVKQKKETIVPSWAIREEDGKYSVFVESFGQRLFVGITDNYEDALKLYESQK